MLTVLGFIALVVTASVPGLLLGAGLREKRRLVLETVAVAVGAATVYGFVISDSVSEHVFGVSALSVAAAMWVCYAVLCVVTFVRARSY